MGNTGGRVRVLCHVFVYLGLLNHYLMIAVKKALGHDGLYFMTLGENEGGNSLKIEKRRVLVDTDTLCR